MPTTKLAIITILEGPTDPGYGVPTPPARPDQGLPPTKPTPPTSGARPEQPIYLPPTVWPPTTTPPSPDNSLPEPPPGYPVHLPVFPPPGDLTKPVDPEQRFVLRYSPVYGWVIVVLPDDSKPQPKK